MRAAVICVAQKRAKAFLPTCGACERKTAIVWDGYQTLRPFRTLPSVPVKLANEITYKAKIT